MCDTTGIHLFKVQCRRVVVSKSAPSFNYDFGLQYVHTRFRGYPQVALYTTYNAEQHLSCLHILHVAIVPSL
jgi:hypothetical protein